MTADRGWVVAGQLAPGERVQRADGTTARVVALRAVAGVGPMWDLTLDAVHTFAVGDGMYVVHNCDDPAAALQQARTQLNVGKERTTGVADFSINGEDGTVMTISGQAHRPGAIDLPETPRFTTKPTGNNSREYNAERKILEHLAMKAEAGGGSGWINLYVDRPPCESCIGVIGQFRDAFPDILLNVHYIPK